MIRRPALLLAILALTLACRILLSPFGLSVNTSTLNQAAPSPAVQMSYGETVEGELDALGDYAFQGSAGDVVVVQMDATDFTPVLSLRNLDGGIAASDDGSDTPTALIGPFVLRQNGVYRISTARRESVSQGRFRLRLEKVEVQTIAYGDTVDVAFAASESARYFLFEAGILDRVTVIVAGDAALDTRLRLRDYGDSYDFVADDDSGEGHHPQLRDLQMPYTGQYLLTLERNDSGTSGTVTLALEGRGITSLDDGPQTFTLNSVRSQVLLPFEAQAGEQVRITVAVVAGNAEALRTLVTQDGRSYVVSSGSSLNEVQLYFTVPFDGTVNVILDSLVAVDVWVRLERLVPGGDRT